MAMTMTERQSVAAVRETAASAPSSSNKLVPVRYIFTLLVSVGLAIIYGLKVRQYNQSYTVIIHTC